MLGLSQRATVRVIDSRTSEAVSFAHVYAESADGILQFSEVTDRLGEAHFNLRQPTRFSVSFVGYKSFQADVRPGELLEVKLEPSVFTVEEVVVTAQYTPERADKSIYRVKVINSRQIEEKAANDLSELLSNELNIRLNQDASLGSSMSLQGLTGEHIKFLVDGVPVVGRENGNIDLGQINLSQVDHIEIVEGPMSVVYGSNALAGAINIITKENRFNALSANASAYYESVGIYQFNGGVAMRKGRHGFNLQAGRKFFQGYSEVDTTRSKQWNPKRQYNVDAYYTYRYQQSRLKFAGSYFSELLKDRGNIPLNVQVLDHDFFTNRANGRMEYRREVSKGRYIEMVNSYSFYEKRKETFVKDLSTLTETPGRPEDQDTTRFNAWLFRGTYARSHQDWQLEYQLGYDVNLESGNGKRLQNGQEQINDYALFLTGRMVPLKRLTIQPGLRLAYNSRYKAPLVYSMNVKWDPMENLQLRASYARGFRAPSLKELYLNFKDVNHNLEGNPDLAAEYSHNLNLSMDYKRVKNRHTIGFQSSLFYNVIENSINLVPVDNGANEPLWTYVNVEDFKSLGYSLRLLYGFHPKWEATVGYARTGRQSSLEESLLQTGWLYADDLSAGLRFRLPAEDLNINLDYKYTGTYPQYALNTEGDLYVGRIADYHNLDLAVKKAFWEQRLELTLGGKNLFDVKSLTAPGSSGGVHSGGGNLPVAWGRTWFVQLNLAFNKR